MVRSACVCSGLLVLLLALSGCEAEIAPIPAQPNGCDGSTSTVACSCPDGTASTRPCLAVNTPGECACPDATVDLPDDADADEEATEPEVSGDGFPELDDPDPEVIEPAGQPCIEVLERGEVVDAAGIDFGVVQRTEPRSVTLAVRNCASVVDGAPLRLDNIELVDDADRSPTSFALAELPPLPASIEPGEEAAFELSCAPQSPDIPYRGGVLVTSNDPVRPALEVPASCLGSESRPPTCVIGCRVAGIGDYAPTVITTPRSGVVCSARGSVDDDGSVVDWAWSVVEQPAGSTAQPVPEDAEVVAVNVPLSGRYVIEATCFDDDGNASRVPCDSDNDRVPDARGCEWDGLDCPVEAGVADLSACEDARTDRAIVRASPGTDIAVELIWSTPGDPDETDEGFQVGSDLDLHVLNTIGCWNDPLWDCSYANAAPDWGAEEDDTDNPALDRDDSDGAGPEDFVYDLAADGTYRVGVHYFDDHGFGESFATVRIYVFSELVYEVRDKPLAGSGVWWDVATITWPGGTVVPADRLYEGSPPPCD